LVTGTTRLSTSVAYSFVDSADGLVHKPVIVEVVGATLKALLLAALQDIVKLPSVGLLVSNIFSYIRKWIFGI